MERSRSSKRSYYSYDHDPDSPPRSKPPRYHHRRSSADRRAPPPPPPPPPPPVAKPDAPTTFYRLLCPDDLIDAVVGKSGSVIKAFRQDTGAWITVHPLSPGDDERIIETSDNRRRESDGRPPQYSPAQEALLLVHERVLDLGDADTDEGWERGGRVTTRLVVPRMHVGCLMGKGGKIIEQMRIETKTHIRILPREGNVPRCVAGSEEVVQVVGEMNAVKKAVAIISSRLKESLHRDRGPSFRGRLHSPDRPLPDDDFGLYGSSSGQQFSDEVDPVPRSSGGFGRARSSSNPSRALGYAFESDTATMLESASTPIENIVFRILCPNTKVERVMGESDGILDLLQNEVGVDVIVDIPSPDSDECIINISSEEGPDHELFPAQEALLHIQSRIVDLQPDIDNIITTRLLVPVSDIGCFEGRNGQLSDIQKITNASIQIVAREDSPVCVSESDQLIQIVGEIRVARNALVHITEKLRDWLYREVSAPKDYLPSSASAPSMNSGSADDTFHEGFRGNDVHSAGSQSIMIAGWQAKDIGDLGNENSNQEESSIREHSKHRVQLSTPVIAKKTLEVVVPEHAVPILTGRSASKLLLISEISGATVGFMEDSLPKIIQISGNSEQADKAQSLLQGFILSTLDDAPRT